MAVAMYTTAMTTDHLPLKIAMVMVLVISNDNSPNKYNADQADNDGDGFGNACDSTPNGTDDYSATIV